MIYENVQDFLKNTPKGVSIIALDVGTKKIGIAVTDNEQIIPSPFEVYQRRNTSKDLGHIAQLAKDKNAGGFVVGLPIDLDGNEQKNCEKIRFFANKIYKKTGLNIFMQDERMSTAAADRVLSDAGVKRKKRNEIDDKIAASYILEMVLNSRP